MTSPVTEVPSFSKRFGRGLRLLGGLLLVVVTITAANAYTSVLPDRSDMDRAFARSAPMNTPVAAREFTAEVLAVRGGAFLNDRDGFTHETAGAWVIIKVRVTALTETTMLSSLALLDGSGRVFTATERVSQPLLNRVLQPGIPVVGEVAIEVPKDARGFVLRISNTTNDALDAVVDVAVPVSDVSVWLRDKRPIVLAPTKVDLG